MDLENLTTQEKEFRRSLEAAGVPTTDAAFRAEWQGLADAAGIPIANASPFSAFWVLLSSIATRPALWLVAFMVRVVMPNCYVKTAAGAWLDLLGWAYNIERKAAEKARGHVTFRRVNAAQPAEIPAGTAVRTVPIGGVIYRLSTLADAVIPAGSFALDVLCEAEAAGSGYNLAGGYYSLLDSDVPGITGAVNPADWLESPGAEQESDDQFRLRIRYQFAGAGDWHTDAKYRSLIAARTGFRADRIYFVRYDSASYPCRGPGSADAFVLFDTAFDPANVLADVNDYIRAQGNHGHGDDLLVQAIPSTLHDVAVAVVFRTSVTAARRAEVLAAIGQVIRCAFRENEAYLDNVTQTWPYSRFAFSKLGQELHDLFYEVAALEWGQDDIVSELDIPRLATLTVQEG